MDLKNRKQNWKALVADSIENEKSRVNATFLAWVYGSAMMGSTEQRWIPWEKMMNSVLDTLNLIQ